MKELDHLSPVVLYSGTGPEQVVEGAGGMIASGAFGIVSGVIFGDAMGC